MWAKTLPQTQAPSYRPESAPHIHSPHSGGTTGVSACERTCSTNRWRAWPPNSSLSCCLLLVHAHLWPWAWGGAEERAFRLSQEVPAGSHPCRPKGRTQTVISSRSKGSWVMIGEHWTGSQDLELFHQSAWSVPTR